MQSIRYYIDRVEEHLPFKPSKWDRKYQLAILFLAILLFIMAIVAFVLHDKVYTLFTCGELIIDCECSGSVCTESCRVSWIMAGSCISTHTCFLSSSFRSRTYCCVCSHRLCCAETRLVGFVWSFPIAFLLVCFGSIIGESLLFLSFRHFFHSRIQQFRKEHEENYGTMVNVINQHKRWMVFLIRLSAIPVCYSPLAALSS